MRFRLHRSLIFWAGVLMTVFIGWAARKSREYWSGVSGGGYGVESALGGVLVQRKSFEPSWRVVHDRVPPVREALELPFYLRGQEGPLPQGWKTDTIWSCRELFVSFMSFQSRKDWVLFLPYWLLWMVMAVVWMGLLVWRQRRGREMIDEI